MQNKSKMRGERIRFILPRVLCVFMTALFMCFIFSNSLDTAEKSSKKSSIVTEAAQTVVDAVSPGTVVQEHVIRKLGHFSEFAVLGAMLLICVRIYTKKYMKYIFVPLFVSLAAGVTDELIQLASSGRSSEVTDVAIDFSGAAAGIILCILFIIIHEHMSARRKIRRGNRKCSEE